jgi:hypothetical protein
VWTLAGSRPIERTSGLSAALNNRFRAEVGGCPGA